MPQQTQIGKLAVRRSIEINASPERVWEEFSSAERFRLWYTPSGGVEMPRKHLEYEPRVGGNFATDVDHGHDKIHFEGRVLVFDPPRELSVEIVHHGFESFGDAAESVYRAFEGGWDMTVPTALRNLVETGKATG